MTNTETLLIVLTVVAVVVMLSMSTLIDVHMTRRFRQHRQETPRGHKDGELVK